MKDRNGNDLENDQIKGPRPEKQKTKGGDIEPNEFTTPSFSLRSRTSASSLPHYYDSEPSSQPPNYAKSPSPSKISRTLKPAPPQAGASAASIAAVLGVSSLDEVYALEKQKEKRSFVRRAKDFVTGKGWVPPVDGPPDAGSSADWNYYGSRVDYRMNKERVLRR
ncbi:hypothetical protein EJ04DRAFT_568628 [Polyplosphaeria fusca]|uniref:Uncharacterized protein n=1 Tax=Polyplosphaeria fusca TaxID=682080 RepID=A0A9P4QR81_9PLEO|nr:hypothetical protein EJ04DRAFT_568628 [Polyplosphaeria fusca]